MEVHVREIHESQIELTTLIVESDRNKKITGFRYGKILDVDENSDTIFVDYAENPLKERLRAKLASPYLTLDDLKEATHRPAVVQLDFIEGDPSKPLVRDIYFSLADQVREKKEEIVEKTVHLKADRLILEGTTEVIIQSGGVRSVYKASEGKLTEEAEKIRSSANRSHRIQGGSVLIN